MICGAWSAGPGAGALWLASKAVLDLRGLPSAFTDVQNPKGWRHAQASTERCPYGVPWQTRTREFYALHCVIKAAIAMEEKSCRFTSRKKASAILFFSWTLSSLFQGKSGFLQCFVFLWEFLIHLNLAILDLAPLFLLSCHCVFFPPKLSGLNHWFNFCLITSIFNFWPIRSLVLPKHVCPTPAW